MPEKQKVPVVKAGDVTQRVKVIRARGVDVEKLIKMLNAGIRNRAMRAFS